jgi:hypothetical protein
MREVIPAVDISLAAEFIQALKSEYINPPEKLTNLLQPSSSRVTIAPSI